MCAFWPPLDSSSAISVPNEFLKSFNRQIVLPNVAFGGNNRREPRAARSPFVYHPPRYVVPAVLPPRGAPRQGAPRPNRRRLRGGSRCWRQAGRPDGNGRPHTGRESLTPAFGASAHIQPWCSASIAEHTGRSCWNPPTEASTPLASADPFPHTFRAHALGLCKSVRISAWPPPDSEESSHMRKRSRPWEEAFLTALESTGVIS